MNKQGGNMAKIIDEFYNLSNINITQANNYTVIECNDGDTCRLVEKLFSDYRIRYSKLEGSPSNTFESIINSESYTYVDVYTAEAAALQAEQSNIKVIVHAHMFIVTPGPVYIPFRAWKMWEIWFKQRGNHGDLSGDSLSHYLSIFDRSIIPHYKIGITLPPGIYWCNEENPDGVLLLGSHELNYLENKTETEVDISTR